jgi:uncharacterized protein
MTTQVQRNDDASRYELFEDDELIGVADFRVADRFAVLPHTEIASHRRGHGLGAVIVKAALDDLRARGLRVVPRCWYVAQYIDDHPEYRDLLAA